MRKCRWWHIHIMLTKVLRSELAITFIHQGLLSGDLHFWILVSECFDVVTMFDIVHSNVVMIPPLYPAGPFVHFHYSLLNSLPPNMAKKVRSTSIKAWWSSTFIVLLKYSVVAASSPHLFICHSVLRSTHYALLYITWDPFQLGGQTR